MVCGKRVVRERESGSRELERNRGKTVAEVGCKTASGRRKTRGEVLKGRKGENEETQTPRLRAPVGTPRETGVGRPDGRKPEACEGAGPGSGGVTGDPVARRARRRHTRERERWARERSWVVNGVGVTYKGLG